MTWRKNNWVQKNVF